MRVARCAARAGTGLALALLLCAGPVALAQGGAPAEKPGAPSAGAKDPAREQGRPAGAPAQKKPAPAPRDSFEPSRKIRVDSVVSFPVDI